MQEMTRREWLRMMGAAGLFPFFSNFLQSDEPTSDLSASIHIPIDPNNPAIVFDQSKCVYCGACRRVCRRMMSVDGFYDFKKTGNQPICIHCGQCSTVCEGEAIVMRPEWQSVKAAKAAGKTVVVSLSPAVRVAVSEAFGQPAGTFCEGEVIAALRALGADYVLDVSFGADLTIIEEAKELVERLKHQSAPLPQFTSCCPAWVEFCETYFPHYLPNVSTAKSPIAMQGVAVKTFFAKQKGLDPKNIFNVALTPCSAKKFEIRRPEFEVEGMRGMDAIVTVRELADWIRAEKVDYENLSPSSYDSLLGEASSAGIIFGNTGGVAEAILRTAYYFYNGTNPPNEFLQFSAVRGLLGTETQRPGGLKCATAVFSETCSIKVLVVQGCAHAREVLEQLQAGTIEADLIEVMACEGGCVGGAGLPRAKTIPYLTRAMRQARIEALYARGDAVPLHLAHENPIAKQFYAQTIGEMEMRKGAPLLQTSYASRAADLGE